MRLLLRIVGFIGLPALALFAGNGASAVDVALLTNPFSPRTGHPYRNGVMPTLHAHREAVNWLATAAQLYAFSPVEVHNKTLSYGGGVSGIGVTSGPPQVYLVVWGSQWGKESTAKDGTHVYTADAAGQVALLERLFRDLGTGGEQWSGTMTQYCDGPNVTMGATRCPNGATHVSYPTGGAIAGVWYDGAAPSPVYASAHDLAAEAVNAARHFGQTSPASNRYIQYFILSPPGTHPDRFNTGNPDADFCAWHDYSNDPQLDGGPVNAELGGVAFTNMPYLPGNDCGANFVNKGLSGALDGVTIVAGHEYAETLTDQLPAGGWTNPTNIPGLGGGGKR